MHKIETAVDSAADSVGDIDWHGTLQCVLVQPESGRKCYTACGSNKDVLNRAGKRRKSGNVDVVSMPGEHSKYKFRFDRIVP